MVPVILLTAANGRTGRAVLDALGSRGADVRVLVRRAEQAEALTALGAAEVYVGDLTDEGAVSAAAAGCATVIHIGPPMHPDEVAITDRVVKAAIDGGAEHVVYYSVMHPFRREVRHHGLKLQATEHLVEAGIPYTILEPARYMQHLEPLWSRVIEDGVHAMPFSVDVSFNVVDLLDLAEVTARVATEPGHLYATYELAGPQALSQRAMADVLTRALGRDVVAQALSLDAMEAGARAKGISDDRIAQMRIMNAHYDAHGFLGNSNVLEWLLGRPATTYAEYVKRLVDRSTV